MKLITGGSGFIGSALIWKLNALRVNDIVVVDDLGSGGKWRNLRGLHFRDFVDKRKIDPWLDLHQGELEWVVHLGACSNTTESDASYLMENNFEYSKRLWTRCSSLAIPFLYASSAAVYGSGRSGYSETPLDRSLAPLNPYGLSKLLFDRWAMHQTISPSRWAGLRFFNVFGPNEYHKGRMASVALHLFEQHATGGGGTLFKSYDPKVPHGAQARDFIYIKDVINVIVFLLYQEQSAGIINVGTGVSRTFNDLAEAIDDACGTRTRITYVDMPEDVIRSYQSFTEADISKLRQMGYDSPFMTLEEAVGDYVSGYLSCGFKTLGED